MRMLWISCLVLAYAGMAQACRSPQVEQQLFYASVPDAHATARFIARVRITTIEASTFGTPPRGYPQEAMVLEPITPNSHPGEIITFDGASSSCGPFIAVGDEGLIIADDLWDIDGAIAILPILHNDYADRHTR